MKLDPTTRGWVREEIDKRRREKIASELCRGCDRILYGQPGRSEGICKKCKAAAAE